MRMRMPVRICQRISDSGPTQIPPVRRASLVVAGAMLLFQGHRPAPRQIRRLGERGARSNATARTHFRTSRPRVARWPASTSPNRVGTRVRRCASVTHRRAGSHTVARRRDFVSLAAAANHLQLNHAAVPRRGVGQRDETEHANAVRPALVSRRHRVVMRTGRSTMPDRYAREAARKISARIRSSSRVSASSSELWPTLHQTSVRSQSQRIDHPPGSLTARVAPRRTLGRAGGG